MGNEGVRFGVELGRDAVWSQYVAHDGRYGLLGVTEPGCKITLEVSNKAGELMASAPAAQTPHRLFTGGGILSFRHRVVESLRGGCLAAVQFFSISKS